MVGAETDDHSTDPRWVSARREDLLPDEEPVRLLGLDGELVEDVRYPLTLDDDDYRSMYRHMRVTRRLDDESIKLQRQGQLAVYTSCLGQEGAQVGSAYALEQDDWIFPSYREHAVARVRGVDPVLLLSHNRGTWISVHDPKEWRFAPQTVSIGSHLVHAAGLATGAKFAGDPIVAIAYFGDGATSEGSAHEGLNFAGAFQSPAVFFCQNNGWAISVPAGKQTGAPSMAHKAIGYGMPGIRVDGNDVLASYAVTKWAVDRARRGEGPVFIEAMTYRMEAHSTSDDAKRYSTQSVQSWWSDRDPIERFEMFLAARGLLDDEFVAEVDVEAAELCARVRGEIYEAPHGRPDEVFDHVYTAHDPHLERQREQMLREMGAREGDA